MGCTLFSVKFSNAFSYFVVSCLLAKWRYYSIFSIQCIFSLQDQTVPYSSWQAFYTKNFNLQRILNNINELDTSFLDCKHKHMMKSGASYTVCYL